MKQVARYERKFVLPQREYRVQRARMAALLQKDPHTGEDGYPIRSLYFDTPGDSDYFEKLDGAEQRRKLRLRLYGPGDAFAYLEMKQKQGERQLKRSLRLTREDAQLVAAGCYTPLLNYPDAFAAECFALLNIYGYRPKTIVFYTREAFVAPGNDTRVTFDRDIRAAEHSAGLFSPDLYPSPVLPPYWVVLEVKYNGFLHEYVRELVGACGAFLTSSSKYCLGRAVTAPPGY